MKFPYVIQQDSTDCGPACLQMVCQFYGKRISATKLRQLTEIGRDGVNLLGISEAAEKIGFRTIPAQLTFDKLISEARLPCIVHWDQNHFIVVHKIDRRGSRIGIADPAKGLVSINREFFVKHWISSNMDGTECGIALLLEPGPMFDIATSADQSNNVPPRGLQRILNYVYLYKKLIYQLLIGIGLGSLFQLVAPFLTQSVIDTGIRTNDLNFVNVLLMGQLALLVGRLVVEFIRSWILYHISARINIQLLTDFLIKLMNLPVAFFASKQTGDILQRMNDHRRIESFLTGTSLNTLFSLFNLVIYSIILIIYSQTIFLVFLFASVLYSAWIIRFLKSRRALDYKQFSLAAIEQGKTIQLVQAIQDIKLTGSEKMKRWEWERLQAALFRQGMRVLTLNQWEQAGAILINEGKNIFITFYSAKLVIEGHITLGAMMAIQYMIGQLNGPIEQIVNFAQNWQLARISIERLNEINEIEDEEPIEKELSVSLPENKTLELRQVSFAYPGAGNDRVLKDIDLHIPNGKVTAIVGTSGSGKTTLLKLLLKFYVPQSGDITLGNINIANISHRSLRAGFGVVMQESYIFSDSIANNISVGSPVVDMQRVKEAAGVANIQSFIEGLPLHYHTRIGAEGMGISSGQRQRLLIARAVYRNPDIILLDEATNALDAQNESVILQNLQSFLRGKTVIIIAHRLSTVKNADQIIVLDQGRIAEIGDHEELVEREGIYHNLVKNQLELE